MPATRTGAPVTRSERIQAIDVLRGVAVLGILIVNIWSFAWVTAAYSNPSVAPGGGLGGLDLWIWAAVNVFADTKFISIFSLLFGAGIAMMNERMRRRGVPGGRLHYRRQSWLLVIGLLHAYGIWHGDILVPYALCGFVLYGCRDWAPRRLLWAGGCAVGVVVLFMGLAHWTIPDWPAEERAAVAAEWAPSTAEIGAEIEAMRGGWARQMPVRAYYAFLVETVAFAGYLLWRAGGLMLVGMALYKLGVLSARRPVSFYRRLAVWGLGLGLPLAAAGVWYNVTAGFAWEQSKLGGSLFNYVGSVGVFLGYVGLVMLAARSGRLARAQARLAAVGRMALTNYIAQSLICTLIFYGHGLGLFERVGGVGCVAIVVAIWSMQLAWSPWWLARFRFGPLEWLWRTLSYGRRQPMRVGG
ncbi:DUF418 domain-containing protein [Candidatus Palauibacter sp.]|uniref:DUF418 domain-containing protein n=1 Tax=Candidatus Palauibacter sp. TaxID=3101350 RepID=UPI003B01AB5C